MNRKHATNAEGKLRKFFTPEQVAEHLGVHKRTVLRAIQAQRISAVNPFAGVIRIPDDELERLLKLHSIGRVSS